MGDQKRFIPIDKWQAAGHLWPDTEWAWRYLLRTRKNSGLEKCVVKIGKQLLIDEQNFMAWIETHREAAITEPAAARRGGINSRK